GLERRMLRAALLRFAMEPFTSEALEQAYAGQLTGFAVELALERLRERGIIVTRRKSWGETIHSIAPDVFDGWQRHYIPQLDNAMLADESQAGLPEPKADLAKLILLIAAELERRRPALTRSGWLRKADAARLEGRMDVNCEALDG